MLARMRGSKSHGNIYGLTRESHRGEVWEVGYETGIRLWQVLNNRLG